MANTPPTDSQPGRNRYIAATTILHLALAIGVGLVLSQSSAEIAYGKAVGTLEKMTPKQLYEASLDDSLDSIAKISREVDRRFKDVDGCSVLRPSEFKDPYLKAIRLLALRGQHHGCGETTAIDLAGIALQDKHQAVRASAAYALPLFAFSSPNGIESLNKVVMSKDPKVLDQILRSVRIEHLELVNASLVRSAETYGLYEFDKRRSPISCRVLNWQFPDSCADRNARQVDRLETAETVVIAKIASTLNGQARFKVVKAVKGNKTSSLMVPFPCGTPPKRFAGENYALFLTKTGELVKSCQPPVMSVPSGPVGFPAYSMFLIGEQTGHYIRAVDMITNAVYSNNLNLLAALMERIPEMPIQRISPLMFDFLTEISVHGTSKCKNTQADRKKAPDHKAMIVWSFVSANLTRLTDDRPLQLALKEALKACDSFVSVDREALLAALGAIVAPRQSSGHPESTWYKGHPEMKQYDEEQWKQAV